VAAGRSDFRHLGEADDRLSRSHPHLMLIYYYFGGDISTRCGYSTSGRIARNLPPNKKRHSLPAFANSRVSKGLIIFPKLFVLIGIVYFYMQNIITIKYVNYFLGNVAYILGRKEVFHSTP
jgi:hypothetical protein